MNLRGTIVSNTGPLIALASIDQLEILRSIFDLVIVSELVNREIFQGGLTKAGVSAYRKADWISIDSTTDTLDPLLQTVLDPGEAGTIQVALRSKADHVLIDERKGRKIARSIYGLNVVGTARILVEAKHRGILLHVGDTLTKMRDAGYWIHEEIVAAAKKAAGET